MSGSVYAGGGSYASRMDKFDGPATTSSVSFGYTNGLGNKGRCASESVTPEVALAVRRAIFAAVFFFKFLLPLIYSQQHIPQHKQGKKRTGRRSIGRSVPGRKADIHQQE